MKERADRKTKLGRSRVLLRWLLGATCVTFLISISTGWQSWERNTDLQTVTTLPFYFLTIWVGYLLWIANAALIYRWQKLVPMFSDDLPLWWLLHLGLSLIVGITHLMIDTLLLWLALSQSFNYVIGFMEKLIRWLPYELLAYWGCLSVLTLLDKRSNLVHTNSDNYLQRLSFKVEDETRFIPVEKIDYLEACDNYVKIWCGENREMVKMTMASLERRLDPKKFIRIHRSYIVNLDSLKCVNKHNARPMVILNQGKSLAVSRRRQADLNKMFDVRRN